MAKVALIICSCLALLSSVQSIEAWENKYRNPKAKIQESDHYARSYFAHRRRRSAEAGYGNVARTFFFDNPVGASGTEINISALVDRRRYPGLRLPPQIIRLRGDVKKMGPSEGRVEVYDEASRLWGVICDDYWTKTDADVACRQLGFRRGAAMFYGSDRFGPGPWTRADILFSSVNCAGNEDTLQQCQQDIFQVCTGKTSSVTCQLNEGCPKGWLTYKGTCYRLLKQPATFIEQSKTCERENGTLAYILNVEENNFLSNMLMTKFQNLTSVWIGGYYNERVTYNGGTEGQWSWYGTIHNVFQPNLWFPGYRDGPEIKVPRGDPTKASCMVLKKVYEDPFVANAHTNVDYFWWDNESCRKKVPAICQRPMMSGPTECFNGTGSDYRGKISRTDKGSLCASWAHPSAIINPNNYPGKGLGEHNYCRNPENDVKPWCWIKPEESIFGYCNLDRCDQLPTQQVETGALPNDTQAGFDETICSDGRFYCPSLVNIRQYDPCLPADNVCDGAAQCPKGEDEDPQICQRKLCGDSEFYCSSSQYCIGAHLVCDTRADCQNGEDEKNCTVGSENAIQNYQEMPKFRLNQMDRLYMLITLAECATKCRTAMRRNFNCVSFNFKVDNSSGNPITTCELNEKSHKDLAKEALQSASDFTYYFEKQSCDNSFKCWNGNCVPVADQCNGKDDCGDLSDEKNCENTMVTFPPYQVRLSDGRGPYEGRVEVRYQGEWGVICHEDFNLVDANVICKELNFIGAISAIRNAWQRFGRGNGNFLMSGVKCAGNESSLQNCVHNGWRQHSCGADEEAGVECMVNRPCARDEFRCYDGNACISNTKFCDGKRDCLDGSDESGDCTVKVTLKGPTASSGLVYVSRGFMIGTVCKDEFDENDAQVICRMLGFTGKSRPITDGLFGRGNALVMLDNLRCHGNESNLADCPDFKWAESDCDSSEDVGVICDYVEPTTTPVPTTTPEPTTTVETTTRMVVTQTTDKVIPTTVTATTTTEMPTTTITTTTETTTPQLVKGVCGERPIEQSEQRVVGGFEATQGAFPWQVAVRKVVANDGRTQHMCGGTIISEYWVVSAAHCYKNLPKSKYKVRVGDWNNQEETEKYEVDFDIEELLLHPQWAGTRTFDYDLALIRVKPINGRGIQFSPEVQPACLPTDDSLVPTEFHNCYVSGWGYTNREYPPMLQAAVVPLIPREECLQLYRGAITERMQCAGFKAGGIDTCSGDSGGPLVCPVNGKHVLWGATSYGNGCAQPNRPGVYARVKVMLDWVLKTAV